MPNDDQAAAHQREIEQEQVLSGEGMRQAAEEDREEDRQANEQDRHEGENQR